MAVFFDLKVTNFIEADLKLPSLPAEYIKLNFLNIHSNPTNDCPQPFSRSKIYTSTITSSDILAKAEDVKTVYSIELSFDNNENISFVPGDTIEILPNNSDEVVNFVIERLNLVQNCDQLFELQLRENVKKGAKLPVYVPTKFTIRRTIQECLDFYSIPKKV